MNLPPAGLVATPRAVASLRRMTLADGPEAGLDCIALSTGGGLDCWLLAGRSLDIGPLWWRGRQLGWMPAQGFLHPAFRRAEEEGGHGFARLFGGALVTCGLSHIRQPAGGEPLHGRLPFTPARITLCREHDGLLEVEAEIFEARRGDAVLRLRRRIEADAGGATLRLRDEVENIGVSAVPHAVLYHFNFGWPLLVPGTHVELAGRDVTGALAPGDTAAANGPAVSHPAEDGLVRVVAPDGLSATLRFDAATLPFLQIWHDLRPRSAVLSVEPVSTTMGQAAPMLPQGERRTYAIDMTMHET